jgi:phage FluMu protein Com
MAPKYRPTPLSGGDRKALTKEIAKSRVMTGILAERSHEKRRVGEALIREADNLACQSWNEKMWSDGGPAQPSPTIGQAINGGFPWLEVKCSRCKTPSSVDLAIKTADKTDQNSVNAKQKETNACGKSAGLPLCKRRCSKPK